MAAAAEPTLAFTVTRGDTLIGLSSRVLVAPDSWREVAGLNRLALPNRLKPGQVLLIPLRLLRWTPVDATLVSVSGDVLVGGRPGVAQGTMAEATRRLRQIAEDTANPLTSEERLNRLLCSW